MGKITIEESIIENGFHIATVVGDSMMPLLREGIDTVTVVPVTKPLKKLDLPLYKRPSGQYVLHRIIGVRKNHYIICGDNRTNKEKVPKDWIIGVAESFYIGDKKVSVEDPEYIAYVKDVRRKFFPKYIKSLFKRLKNKLIKK